MRNEALVAYLEELMRRRPWLSARRMSVEAGLANNIVTAILSGRTNPTPYTIKKLTDKWGTPGDYLAMMRLAGHLPLDAPGESAPGEELLLRTYRQLDEDGRREALALLKALRGARAAGANKGKG
jgi:hypothetical protein